jgi:hypothetical protein
MTVLRCVPEQVDGRDDELLKHYWRRRILAH